jgi:hypothetical protein
MAGGRPEKIVDWKLVDRLIEAGCNIDEVAGNFDMLGRTLGDKIVKKFGINYTQYSQTIRKKGTSKLRLSQYDKALDNATPGNAQMLIWLGKNLLGQKDSSVQENTVSESTMMQFSLLMKQISELQSQSGSKSESKPDLNIDDNNMMSEQRS